jgi:hypothetical protein
MSATITVKSVTESSRRIAETGKDPAAQFVPVAGENPPDRLTQGWIVVPTGCRGKTSISASLQPKEGRPK